MDVDALFEGHCQCGPLHRENHECPSAGNNTDAHRRPWRQGPLPWYRQPRRDYHTVNYQGTQRSEGVSDEPNDSDYRYRSDYNRFSGHRTSYRMNRESTDFLTPENALEPDKYNERSFVEGGQMADK